MSEDTNPGLASRDRTTWIAPKQDNLENGWLPLPNRHAQINLRKPAWGVVSAPGATRMYLPKEKPVVQIDPKQGGSERNC